jgi:HK97 family phage major capsid protein
MSDEIKGLIEAQGKAFEAFKETHEELKKNDSLTAEKLERIEKSLDDAVEAKAAIEAAVAAERKEREDLEKRLNRHNIKGEGESAVRELEIKTFNEMLAAQAAEQKSAPVVLDANGYDEYKAAFNRFLRKNDRILSSDEIKTLSVGSDPDGGYLVTPDVTGRMVKKVYETSPIRQIASIQVISTDAFEGIEDLGEAGAGYAGEHTTSGDATTPQIGKWRIPVHIIDTEPKATQQLLDDASVDVEAWLADKVGNKLGRFENVEFCTGAANKIMGFAGGYTAAADSGSGVTWGQIGFVKSGANADFTGTTPVDKLLDLVGLLKNDYLGNARFVTRRSVIQLVRKFKDTTGQMLWQPSLVAGAPETLLGHAVTRAEDMPALATNSLSMAFGDMAQAYQIVDRQGLRVLRDPYTAKPYVKFYTTKRTGGGVVNFEAIKLMKFAA